MKKTWAMFLSAVFVVLLILLAGCGATAAQNAEPLPTETLAPEPTPHIHAYYDDGVCRICGAVCLHIWQDGVCRVCGMVCSHEWHNGVCEICHLRCEHEWNGRVCVICGMRCSHRWEDGVCTRCGTVCRHVWHDAETCLCVVCGEKATHEYLNGICTRCGKTPSFITKLIDLPASLGIPAEEHGKVEVFHYLVGEGEVLPGEHGTKTMEERKMRNLAVYTPPGYDPENQYNVLIIAPGAGHNAHFWLEWRNLVSGVLGRIKGSELLDRLIEHGQIEPIIVVVVEYYLNLSPEDVAIAYEKDLRERILPFLAANYGTYAAFCEDGSVIAAPEHFAFAGASYGAMVGWQMLPDCTDLFSYWCLLSGGFQNEEQIIARINEGVAESRKIHWLYTGDGNQAEGWKAYENHMKALNKNCWNLETGENFCFVAVEKSEHSFSTWDVGLFNSLQVFFHSRYAPVHEIPTSARENMLS